MMLGIIFVVYQCLQIIALPIVGLYLVVRRFKGKPVFGNVAQRFGLVPRVSAGKKSLWLHAVSVGEILAVQQLVADLKEKNPDAVCYVTTGTVAGHAMACKFLAADVVSFLPFDFLIPMVMVFKRVRPKALMIVEADLWPNLIMIARWFKVPLYLLNARVNPRSKKRMKFFTWIYMPLLNAFEHIFAQSSDDVQAFEELGVRAAKLSVLGNIKAFNVVAKRDQLVPCVRQHARKNLVLLSASATKSTLVNLYFQKQCYVKRVLFRKMGKAVSAPCACTQRGMLLKTSKQRRHKRGNWPIFLKSNKINQLTLLVSKNYFPDRRIESSSFSINVIA